MDVKVCSLAPEGGLASDPKIGCIEARFELYEEASEPLFRQVLGDSEVRMDAHRHR